MRRDDDGPPRPAADSPEAAGRAEAAGAEAVRAEAPGAAAAAVTWSPPSERWEGRTVALSTDPAGREAQLANLLPDPPPPPPAGNDRAATHRGYAEVVGDRLDEKKQEIVAALASDAPVRDVDGELPRYDQAAVHLLARCLLRLADVETFLDKHGLFDGKGRPRPAVDVEARLRREATGLLVELGMTPKARAALGVDLARMAGSPVAAMQGGRVMPAAVAAGATAGADGGEQR